MSELHVYGFETSNNMKVRVALGLKGLPYRFHAIDPADRSQVLALSKQHLTPILQHDEVVITDSAAILRYLDVNVQPEPPLFGATLQEQWAIEDWELFARATLARPMLDLVHARIAGTPLSDEAQARCTAAFAEACGTLRAALVDCDWLVGDRITAADVTAGAVLHRVRSARLFPWPDAAAAISGWVDRVMAFDGPCRLA